MNTRSNRESVKCAIETICEHRDSASRAQIVSMTGLKMQIVDEHVKNLKTDGLIAMLTPGFYCTVDQEIDRIVSTSMLPRGRVKIEAGDAVLDLNPREAFALAKMLAGALLAFRVGM